MLKEIAILSLLILLSSSQTTVTKAQRCECQYILNQQDCSLQLGCAWIPSDSFNIIAPTGNSNLINTLGTCTIANSTQTTNSSITITQCSAITNSTLCSMTIGCAYFNNTCIVFSGCTAYVQTTTSQCQMVSSQCTTDGSRCVDPSPCTTYNTSALCLGNFQKKFKDNIATTGAKSCKWIEKGSQSNCADKECSDASPTFNTDQLCNGFISGCLTTGQGCTADRKSCTTYPKAVGCTGMIGSEGPCTSNTESGSTVCRPLLCTDAASTLATNADCQKFLSGCLTIGKGCVKTRQSCNTYQQGCASLIGSEGPCTIDSTNSTSCRALTCNDAPNTLNTNDGCNQFLNNCITTGLGCAKSLGLCSAYNGNEQQCNQYIGSDGLCKGTGSSATQQCSVRTCGDAPKTINNDKECNQYQKGCITNGAGCVVNLLPCQQYTGTATTCLLYKGTDGNCTAPSSQTTDGPCSVKFCSAATQNVTTNSGCQSYSYKCVTNGTSCIDAPSCETSQLSVICEGSPTCSYNQICLDRSSCTNYQTQAICLLNQQQYKLGSKTYLRKCQWTTGCQNTLCSSLPTTLKTDADCEAALSGCITKGNGCVDINDNCSSYQGLIGTCKGFKGLNGKNACTQLKSETNASTACVEVNACSQAKDYSSEIQTSNTTCDAFLKGCFFDVRDNCTIGNCTTYYGTQTACSNINTAMSLNKPQKCWKIDQPTNSATACIPRTCAHATVSAQQPFNTDELCQAFLSTCVWNGKSSGGCQDFSTPCSEYTGSTASCMLFAQNRQKCTKTAGFCKVGGKTTTELTSGVDCENLMKPDGVTDQALLGQFCQKYKDKDGNNCQWNDGEKKCKQAFYCIHFVPFGSDDNQKNSYCSGMVVQKSTICKYLSGDKCAFKQCSETLAKGSTSQQKQAFCGALVYIGDTGQHGCSWDQISQNCYQRTSCSSYMIPSQYQNSIKDKVTFCSGRQDKDDKTCTFSGDAMYCQNGVEQCANLIVNDPIAANNMIVCSNSKSKGGYCQWNKAAQTCDAFNCDLKIIELESGVTSSNQAKQQYCQSFIQLCGFDSSNPNNCQKEATDCYNYKTYGVDIEANRQLCLKYKVSGIQCAYGGVGSTCKDYNCMDIQSDFSIQKCQAYHPNCLFDGNSCFPIRQNCSDYIAYADGQGTFCGYKENNKCKDRECSDISAGGSDTICSSYQTGCVFNGVGCSTPVQCGSYTAFGLTQEDKASFCNTRTPQGMGKCTYVAGATLCSYASSLCSDYKVVNFNSVAPIVGCSLLIDSNGSACQYTNGNSCEIGDCKGAPSNVNSDADCKAYKPICLLDTSTPCTSIVCVNAPQTLTTDSDCSTFRHDCVTNGAGCIESFSNCSDFKGTAATCANFKGNNGSQLCGNTSEALATASCQNRICQQNTTAKNDQDCDKWLPPNGNVKTCVWNGTTGCVPPQLCSAFQGTIDTCPKYSATDGPCQGASISASSCSPVICDKAPSSYNTDAQCKSWSPKCMTNGYGCIPIGQCQSIGSNQVCSTYQNSLGCDLANQCMTKPQQCNSFSTHTECNNTPIAGLTLPGCGWNQKTNSCGILSCINLPLTLNTDQLCSQSIAGCTTNGSGCIPKGACSTYDKQACGVATTTDIEKVCIWSGSACRPIQCTDNTTATSDAVCDNYLKGCKTTGSGCLSTVQCQQFTLKSLCIKASNGVPCMWVKTQSNSQGSCINYTKCTDIISSSHQDCQNASPHCTTNGVNCIAITSCAKTLLQASCIIGTDGTCGWLPSSGTLSAQCSLFTNCAEAKGTINDQCKAWGKQCISDGQSCIQQSTCQSYLTKQACSNQGTDGICFWQSEGQSGQGTCRLQVCSDATTNFNSHSGCSQFQAKTQCTTIETGCIELGTCQSYKVKAGCVVGTDGECFWQQSQTNSPDSQCRLKQCTDNILTTSSACLTSISGLKCVSDGITCIKQQLCQNYTTKEACLGGGTDGQCVFTPNSSTDQSNGKCQLFSGCESANQDQQTCLTRQDSCYFNSTTVNGTTTTLCQPHTCQTKALASSCQPIPSFDLQTYQICVLKGTTCVQGNPTQLTSADCFLNSVQTYSWNPITQSCGACKISSQVNNTNNESNQTRSDSEGLLIVLSLIMAIFYS